MHLVEAFIIGWVSLQLLGSFKTADSGFKSLMARRFFLLVIPGNVVGEDSWQPLVPERRDFFQFRSKAARGLPRVVACLQVEP